MKENVVISVLAILVVLGISLGIEVFKYKLCRAQNLGALYCFMHQ